jgi:hypothetical protein
MFNSTFHLLSRRVLLVGRYSSILSLFSQHFLKFATKSGLSEFIYYLQTYVGNFLHNADDSYGFNELPMCEHKCYVGLDCSSKSLCVLEYLNDLYCASRTGNTQDNLQTVNEMMSNN